ncbi:hypothetical protein EG68_00809 [Paragonimus skrjabini miyazakii]|uniref:Adenosine deaminase n=1 Tax=Paragonimus skrjabini miyazakii TaxID=59628 RepID=A0A8S9Z5C9_9TREM|nr:hypothetical protein EG68_00809 [Paragonimus skrjabini miyazakii]
MYLNNDLKGIELHLHLDGAIRPTTLFEIAKLRDPAHKCANVDEFMHLLRPKSPYSLGKFLESFKYVLPIVAGDKEALTRMTLECIEDCAIKSGLCYVELRFAPYCLCGPSLDPEAVVLTVLAAIKRASRVYGLEARLILCIIREMPETADAVVQLAVKYQGQGVVGIDIAGDDSLWNPEGISNEIVKAYALAERYNVHRTAHAGENSPAAAVHEAVYTLRAERIGHGYNVVHNPSLYSLVKRTNVHFEVCPSSSIVTGAVHPDSLDQHPVHQFHLDGLSYSLNTDDPLITGKWIAEELEFCTNQLGLPLGAIHQSKLHAVKAAFLDTEEERAMLLKHILT